LALRIGILNRLFGRAEKYPKNNHVFSLSIFYVAVWYAFELTSQLLLVKTPKPNPVRSQALIQQNRLIGIIDLSQMWLLGHVEHTASSLIHQWILFR
jgi:hypothetical protein